MENRCDSVDALMYAYYEFMKMKEANKMLEKDKNCIEFSMRSMMATHKPYQEDTEIAITGMAPGKSPLLANNPFDIPCDVVVVSKRYFERLQASVASHEKQDEEYLNFLKALFPDEDVEKLAWMTRQICEPVVSHGAAKYWRDKCEQLLADLEFHKEMAKNHEADYKLLLEETGFDTVEELVNYLNSEAECDTLREAIASLEYSVKFARDERRDLSKKLEECEKDYISARDKVEALEKEIEFYRRALKEWKEATDCPSPSSAKTIIESQASWCHAYHEIKAANEKLADSIQKWKDMTKCETPEEAKNWADKLSADYGNLAKAVLSWQNITGYSTPEEYTARKILTIASAYDVEKEWKEATGCETPKVAYVAMDGFKELIKKKDKEIEELRADYSHILLTTGFESEGEIEDALDKCDHSSLRKALVDYEFDYEALLKLTGYKSERDIRDALRGEKYPYQTMRDLINSLRRKAKWNL